jgi:hypothetical protein
MYSDGHTLIDQAFVATVKTRRLPAVAEMSGNPAASTFLH